MSMVFIELYLCNLQNRTHFSVTRATLQSEVGNDGNWALSIMQKASLPSSQTSPTPTTSPSQPSSPTSLTLNFDFAIFKLFSQLVSNLMIDKSFAYI